MTTPPPRRFRGRAGTEEIAMLRKLVGSVRFIRAFTRLVEDPSQLDVVFELGRHALHGPALPPELARPEVLAYVRASEPPRPLDIDLEALRGQPEGTLGRAFADWLTAQGFKPGELMEYDRRHNQGDNEVVRYRTHLQSTHDLWHVLTGFGTDVDGEVGLQAFYLAQLNTPLAPIVMAAALLRALRRRLDITGLMDAITRGWRMGKAARPLFGTDWASFWSTPVSEVRARFGLAPADVVSGNTDTASPNAGLAPARAA
jgi:ubiquinone biosynthesis protein COQ4